MKLTYVALALTLVMVGISAFLVFQGSQDRARVEQLEEQIATAQHSASAASAAIAEKIQQIEMQTGAQQDELAKLGAERDAIESERAMLNSKIHQLQSDAQAARAEADVAKLEAAGAVGEAKAKQDAVLTPFQKAIRDAAAIGNVREYNQDWAFVVIDAGSERGIEAGDEFALRREHYLVGKVKVSSVEPATSVANLETGSIPLGMSILPGDSVIKTPAQQ